MSLLLRSFYFGLVLCYRYALDAIVGGDFLHCVGELPQELGVSR